MKAPLFFAACLCLFAASGAMAATDCAAPFAVEAPLDGPLQPKTRVKNFRAAFQLCRNATGVEKIATRRMSVDGEEAILLVDAATLDTALAPTACWTCEETSQQAQAATRFSRAVTTAARERGKALPPGADWLENAGLKHGSGDGIFVTGDLCPSHKKLDRDFLASLARPGEATPVALSITGLWIERHLEDFRWLRREKAEGRLAISWVDHSYHHPYRPGVPDKATYLLTPGVDFSQEIFDLERLLIANGEVPGVFFRFPGLISSESQMQALAEAHLIALGADAWLALTGAARPGAVVLVHPNGNEPFGLEKYLELRRRDALPHTLRPLNEAP